MTPTIRASALASFGEVARSLGLNPAALMRRVGLDPQALTNPDMRLNARAFGELLELSAAEAGCPTFGLRMAENRKASDFGPLSLVMTHQPTVRDVLATAVRYSALINDTLTLALEEADGTVVIREEVLAVSPILARQAHELTVGVMVRIFQALIGERWRAVSVHFIHPAPADLSDHRRVFGDGVVFGCDFNGLVCDARDLDLANPAADPVLAAYARRFVDGMVAATGPGTSRRDDQSVRSAIAELLPAGRATLDQVAGRLGLGARTLQRRLADNGSDFRGLLEEVRAALARRFVENSDLPLTDVAQLLGYSQPAAFSRWFLARFGAPPSALRRRTRPDSRQDLRQGRK
eukprot:gene18082-18321_t